MVLSLIARAPVTDRSATRFNAVGARDERLSCGVDRLLGVLPLQRPSVPWWWRFRFWYGSRGH